MKVALVSPSSLLHDPAYSLLKNRLIESTGLAYYLNQEEYLAARIANRLEILGLDHLNAYLDRLSDNHAGEAEWDALVSSLTIGETFFFRHREQFDALRDRLLPELIERNRHHRRLRIWSAGCATGAELYSVAILLRRELVHLVAGWDISILGTDINREFLVQAQRGEFAEWAFRAGSEDIKRSCFMHSEKLWTIRPEFNQGVSFQYHNLVQHPFPSLLNNLSAFDLILCRNVMIYFDHGVVHRLVNQFYQCLVDGGWFLVGHAEPNTELFRSFHTVNVPGAVLYQKRKEALPLSGPCPAPIDHDESRSLAVQGPSLVKAAFQPTRKDVLKRHPAVSIARREPKQEPTNVAKELANIREKADRAEWQEAARLCDKLIASDRLNSRVHFYHALVLEQMGRPRESEQALGRAIYLDRHFVLAHYHLGLLLQKRENISAAKRSFRNTIALLDRMDENHTFEDADGLTVGALKQLTQTHLEMLCRS